MLQAVQDATSETFEAALLLLNSIQRAEVLAAFVELKSKLCEILQEKNLFWNHIPWRMLGVFHGVLSGGWEIARDILRACIAEYDLAVANGLFKTLHRVAVRLLDPARTIGAEFRRCVNNIEQLPQFCHAYSALLKYALCELVERRVESIHAGIKRCGSKATNITPPYICALVREKSHLDLLQSSPAFFQFCAETWKKRNVLDRLLTQRLNAETLAGMTKVQKIRAVYQCDLMSEFLDTSSMRAAQDHFQDTTASILQICDRPVSESLRQCGLYLKFVFNSSVSYFCLPTGVFQEWAGLAATGSYPIDVSPVAALLDVASNPHDEIVFDRLEEWYVFRVVNAYPERRTQVNVPHVGRTRLEVLVQSCSIVASMQEGHALLVQEPATEPIKLDCNWLAQRATKALPFLFRLSVMQRRSTVVPKPEAQRPMCLGNTERYCLPPLVDHAAATVVRPRASGSASSTDIVPISDDASRHTSIALGQLQDMGAAAASVDFERLNNVHNDVLHRLEDANVVSLQVNEWGDMNVRLKPAAVVSTSLTLIGNSIQAAQLLQPFGN